MSGNWCTHVVLLFRRDLMTGKKEFIAAFSALKSAQLYRRRHFEEEVKKTPEEFTFNYMFPIEKVQVLYQDALPKK